MTRPRILKKLFAALLCASFFSACSSTPEKNAKLESAKSVYQMARNSADVTAAPASQVHLSEAGELLEKAEKANKDGETQQVEHFAHMSEAKTRIAMEIAERKAAERDVEQLGKEKTKVQLKARELEAERAQALAEAKAREAEMKAREAEARAREAEMARQQAEMAQEQMEREAEKVRALQKQLEELQAKQTERGLVLTLGDVLFASGKADLLPGAAGSIDKLAAFLKENPERKVLIEGHTDSKGSESYNMELSRSRAASVRLALIERGIGIDRISAEGYGETRPVADNSNAGGRQQNRRVEIVILK